MGDADEHGAVAPGPARQQDHAPLRQTFQQDLGDTLKCPVHQHAIKKTKLRQQAEGVALEDPHIGEAKPSQPSGAFHRQRLEDFA